MAYDYIIFCLRTCYSRSLFFLFPNKLKRLKEEREEIGKEMREIIDRNKDDVSPEYMELMGNNMVDVAKDDLRYLEDLYLKRRRSSRMDIFEDFEFDGLETNADHK